MLEVDVTFGSEVCYPGGDVPQKTICLKLNLFKGVGFTAILMVLSLKALMLYLEWTNSVSIKDLWIVLQRVLS
jgi:hypothetical protein